MRAQNEHRAARFRSCYFYYFLREYIDKMNKKVHNKFTNEYRHIQEHGFALFCAEHRETGCESPTQNGTVRCMFFPTAQQRGHSGETGEGFAERTGESPRTKSGYSVPSLFGGFPAGAYAVHKNVCTKAKKWLWCFFILTRRSGTAPILYIVKNDKF